MIEIWVPRILLQCSKESCLCPYRVVRMDSAEGPGKLSSRIPGDYLNLPLHLLAVVSILFVRNGLLLTDFPFR